MNMYGNVATAKFGTSLAIRLNGPGVVNAKRIAMLTRLSKPNPFHPSASR